MRPRLKTVVVLALALGGIGWTVQASSDPPAVPQPSPATDLGPRRVGVERTTTQDQAEVAVFHGVTRAVDRTVVAFTIPGRLQARPVEVGSKVGKGDVLARLDAKPLRNARSAAKARLAELEARRVQLDRDKQRAQNLLDAGAATTQQLEQASSGAEAIGAAQEAAAASLAESRRQLGESVLRAPFAAEVSAVFVEPGQVVDGGTPVVQLRGVARKEVELSVPARVAANLAVGMAVRVLSPESDEQSSTGVVRRVATVSAGPGQLYSVLIELAEADAPEGVAVRVRLPVAVHRRVSIPVAALLDPSGTRPHVFVHEDGVVRSQPVEVAAIVSQRVLLERGLEPDQEVVVSGLPHLLDGDAVEVLP